MEETSEQGIQYRIPDWFSDLDSNKLSSLRLFFDQLLKFNKVLNLVSPKTLPVTDLLHFADSIMACRIIHSNMTKPGHAIYDIGSGNGFPGLVFAILYNETKVVLVDSDSKKCDFLRHLVGLLKLTNVQVMCASAETLPENSIHYAMSRGFATIPKAILTLRKQVIKGGVYFHLKTDEWGMEVTQIPPQLCSIWSASLVSNYKLPIGSIPFSVVKTDKI